ncbi:hypothetical protein [Bacillus atrophaeus]|uniref:hypothetical protein n=1 Tax=Bacillus atrophaeus TaxID=1452 RepID=UPI0022826F82|nr:hypothetical protein [Bacillus atrophaeus]MCY8497589.1 hypothetical protein [Bacillus atrophaeus]MCY8814312.1 hypothetical protein [Bacillus atrophaeus]MCY8816168.1 hypothetical protein [Bacillus atrophaeus]MCY8823091.1 hypothetical protein [Bacillus atrophaeus]MCY8828685.1 hypothetical protein [Bacillus atrophaeus]
MKFVDKLLGFLKSAFEWLGDLFTNFFQFLAKPFAYLFYFLEGVFYFVTKVFEVVVAVVMIFVALFQFIFSLFAGVLRTIAMWLGVYPSGGVSMPSTTGKAFEVVRDILQPTGMLTIVPTVATAFIWFYFIIKIIGLLGGNITVSPFKR